MVGGQPRVLDGHVTSTGKNKTIMVEVKTRRGHPYYGKVVLVQDKKNKCRVGDLVRIEESRLPSGEMRWRLRVNLIRDRKRRSAAAQSIEDTVRVVRTRDRKRHGGGSNSAPARSRKKRPGRSEWQAGPTGRLRIGGKVGGGSSAPARSQKKRPGRPARQASPTGRPQTGGKVGGKTSGRIKWLQRRNAELASLVPRLLHTTQHGPGC